MIYVHISWRHEPWKTYGPYTKIVKDMWDKDTVGITPLGKREELFGMTAWQDGYCETCSYDTVGISTDSKSDAVVSFRIEYSTFESPPDD